MIMFHHVSSMEPATRSLGVSMVIASWRTMPCSSMWASAWPNGTYGLSIKKHGVLRASKNQCIINYKKWYTITYMQDTCCHLRQLKKNKVGQRTQKQDGTQHDFFENLVVCALHEIDVRSLLKHRARWWYQGPQFTTACCVSYVYILLVAISANVINSIPSF